MLAKVGLGARRRAAAAAHGERLPAGAARAASTPSPGDRSAGLPAVSVAGQPEGEEPINDVTTASLDYEHTGRRRRGVLSAKAYYQDFSALFGGGRFATFQDPRIAPVGELFDQSENNSQKLGTRLTYARAASWRRRRWTSSRASTSCATGPSSAWCRPTATGCRRRGSSTTRPSCSSTRGRSAGSRSRAGVRWEVAALDVPDFTTLAGNRDGPPAGARWRAGSPSFDEPLLQRRRGASPRWRGCASTAPSRRRTPCPTWGACCAASREPGTAVERLPGSDAHQDRQPSRSAPPWANERAGWGRPTSSRSRTWARAWSRTRTASSRSGASPRGRAAGS